MGEKGRKVVGEREEVKVNYESQKGFSSPRAERNIEKFEYANEKREEKKQSTSSLAFSSSNWKYFYVPLWLEHADRKFTQTSLSLFAHFSRMPSGASEVSARLSLRRNIANNTNWIINKLSFSFSSPLARLFKSLVVYVSHDFYVNTWTFFFAFLLLQLKKSAPALSPIHIRHNFTLSQLHFNIHEQQI